MDLVPYHAREKGVLTDSSFFAQVYRYVCPSVLYEDSSTRTTLTHPYFSTSLVSNHRRTGTGLVTEDGSSLDWSRTFWVLRGTRFEVVFFPPLQIPHGSQSVRDPTKRFGTLGLYSSLHCTGSSLRQRLLPDGPRFRTPQGNRLRVLRATPLLWTRSQ